MVKVLRDEFQRATAPGLQASVGQQSLRDRGIDELPPAGFLAIATGQATMDSLEVVFGDHVDLRMCHVRADHVAGAVEQAQHLDRIPLDSDVKPAVDVLVPDVPADLPGLRTESYGWVAFVRRSDAGCDRAPAAREPVDVYQGVGDASSVLADLTTAFKNGTTPKAAWIVGQLDYPAGSWEYPGGEIARKMIDRIIATEKLEILAVASSEDRRPLMALRASLFAACLDKELSPPPVASAALGDVTTEAIVVIQPAQIS
jgi:hypothetical protein